jgi:HPt (histidine-containing phosphotransfer) domain-containing protein
VTPPPVSIQEPPAVERSVIAELRRIFTPAQFDSFLADALDDIPKRMQRLSDQVEAGDLGTAIREAHDLVSLIGNCGGKQASALARAVEQACRAGNQPVAAEQLQAFTTAAVAALAELAMMRQLVD